MITAQQAKEQTDKVNGAPFHIVRAIERSINKGQYTVIISSADIVSPTVARLTELGYSVMREDTVTTISWQSD